MTDIFDIIAPEGEPLLSGAEASQVDVSMGERLPGQPEAEVVQAEWQPASTDVAQTDGPTAEKENPAEAVAAAKPDAPEQDGCVAQPAAVLMAQQSLNVALHNEDVLTNLENMLRKICRVVFGISDFHMARSDHIKFLNGFNTFSSQVDNVYQHLVGVKLTFKSSKTKVDMSKLGHMKPFYQSCLEGNSKGDVVIYLVRHMGEPQIKQVNMFMINYVSMAQQVFPKIDPNHHDLDLTNPASFYNIIRSTISECGNQCKFIRMSWNLSSENFVGATSFHEYFPTVECNGLVGPIICLRSEKAVQRMKKASRARVSHGNDEEEDIKREMRQEVARKIRGSKEAVFKLAPELSPQEKRMRDLTFLKEKLHNIQSDDLLGWQMMPPELLAELLGAHAKTYGQPLPGATQSENWMRTNVSWLASQRRMELENGEMHRDLRAEEDHFMSAMLLREHEEKMQGSRQRYVPTEFATQVVPATVLNLTCESLMEIDAAIMSLAGKLQVDKMEDLSSPEGMDGDAMYAKLGEILQKSKDEDSECQERTPLQVKLACKLAWNFVSMSRSPNESVKHLRFFLLCCSEPWLRPLVCSQDVVEMFCSLPEDESNDACDYFQQLCWEYHKKLREGKVPKHLNQAWKPLPSSLEYLRAAINANQRKRVRKTGE